MLLTRAIDMAAVVTLMCPRARHRRAHPRAYRRDRVAQGHPAYQAAAQVEYSSMWRVHNVLHQALRRSPATRERGSRRRGILAQLV